MPISVSVMSNEALGRVHITMKCYVECILYLCETIPLS